MQGTIVAVNQAKGYCQIHNEKVAETYQADLGEFSKDPAMVVGSDSEFEVLKSPSFLSLGKAKLTSCTALDLQNTKVALTSEHRYSGHDTVKDSQDYFIAAEGAFERECRSALIEKAIESNCNALLDLKLECIIRPGVKRVLFRYTARPAVITGPKYQPEPGLGLKLDTKVARRNSPNEAQVRYIRVLVISFLFIAIPCIMSLTQRQVIPSQLMGQIITAGVIVLSMVLFMCMSSTKRKSFILALKRARK